MILRESRAERGIAAQIDVIQASPEVSSRSANSSAEPQMERERLRERQMEREGFS